MVDSHLRFGLNTLQAPSLQGGVSAFQKATNNDAFSVSMVTVPVLTKETFAQLTGIPIGVLIAQCDRGMWGPPFRVGKRALVNVEYVRLLALKQAQEFLP